MPPRAERACPCAAPRGRPRAAVRFAYDTTELDATAGDRVIVIVDDPRTGQSWCRTPDGREGWLPRDILE